MYTAAIIEDTNKSYEDVIKNFALFYEGKVAIANIPCIKYIERFVPQNNGIKRGYSLFEYYVSIIENTPADIYIVDWDLKFPDDETHSPEEIFNLLPKTFKYGDKYWIFYSYPKANLLLEFTDKAFLNESNVKRVGKSSIVDTPKENEVNLFTKNINAAIAYLEANKTISWAGEKETREEFIEFQGTFYDLEKPDPLEKSNRLKKFWFNKDYIVCIAFDKPDSIIVFIHGGRVKIFYANTGSMSEFRQKLSLEGDRSFFYNKTYFDDNEQLKIKFKKEINQKAAILQVEYLNHNNKSKAKIKRALHKQIEILKQHGVI